MSSTAVPPVREEPFVPPPAEAAEKQPERPGILSLDLRSLALFRMLTGAIVAIDVASTIPQINDFYSDVSVLPRDALVSKFGLPYLPSLYLMSGGWAIPLLLMLVTIVAACCMMVGYRTRLSTFVTWVLILSMQNRNGMILHGGDDLVRMMLFWGMFAPLNGRWSVDRALNPSSPPLPDADYSWGTQALMFQLCFVYWFTAAWKWNPVWTTEGSAVYYALSLDQFSHPLGSFLLQYPSLLRVLTHATYALELLGPFLVLAPFWNAQIRLLMVASFISFHAGIGFSMALGNFPWICVASWLIFVPTLFWDRWIPAAATRVISGAGKLTAPVVRFFSRWSSPPPPRRLGLIPNAVVLSLMLIVFTGSVGALPFMQFAMPAPLIRIALTLNIRQRWSMFAPNPSREDGWYVTEGTLKSGNVVDVWNGGTPTERKPADVMQTYRDSKWRKYLTNSWGAVNKAYRPYFALYLCRQYNARHPEDELQSIVIDYMLELTPPPGQPLPTPQKYELWRQKCSDPPPTN